MANRHCLIFLYIVAEYKLSYCHRSKLLSVDYKALGIININISFK